MMPVVPTILIKQLIKKININKLKEDAGGPNCKNKCQSHYQSPKIKYIDIKLSFQNRGKLRLKFRIAETKFYFHIFLLKSKVP